MEKYKIIQRISFTIKPRLTRQRLTKIAIFVVAFEQKTAYHKSLIQLIVLCINDQWQ